MDTANDAPAEAKARASKVIDQPAPGANRATELNTFDKFIRVLEDGQVNQDLTDALEKMATELTDFTQAYGSSKVKGKITLSLDVLLDKGVFEIAAKVTEKHPEAPRGKTILWSTADNIFTPQNPRQIDMFGGPRDTF